MIYHGGKSRDNRGKIQTWEKLYFSRWRTNVEVNNRLKIWRRISKTQHDEHKQKNIRRGSSSCFFSVTLKCVYIHIYIILLLGSYTYEHYEKKIQLKGQEIPEFQSFVCGYQIIICMLYQSARTVIITYHSFGWLKTTDFLQFWRL